MASCPVERCLHDPQQCNPVQMYQAFQSGAASVDASFLGTCTPLPVEQCGTAGGRGASLLLLMPQLPRPRREQRQQQ